MYAPSCAYFAASTTFGIVFSGAEEAGFFSFSPCLLSLRCSSTSMNVIFIKIEP